MISDQIQSNQSLAKDRTAQQLNEHSRLLTHILGSQSSLHHILSTTTQSQVGTQRATISPSEQSVCRVIQIKASYHQRWPCTAYCKCTCHKVKTFQSPALLKRIIGTLFIKYSGYPACMGTPQRCTDADCVSQITFQTTVYYLFPSWFIAKAFILGLTTQSLGEISGSLKVQRIVPDGSEAFRLAQLGSVDGLKSLFRQGLASPFDVTVNGLSLIRVRFSTYPLSKIKDLPIHKRSCSLGSK